MAYCILYEIMLQPQVAGKQEVDMILIKYSNSQVRSNM